MVHSSAPIQSCLPAALPVADLLATVYRPLHPLPPNPAPAQHRAVQARLGHLATVMADLLSPEAGWPAHLPRTPAALLPYIAEEVEAVREVGAMAKGRSETMAQPDPLVPRVGVLEDWATWVLGQLVACGPEVMALLEGGAVRLVPVMTLALPQVYALDLVTRAPWDATTALPPDTPISLPLSPTAPPLPASTLLDRLWQRLQVSCPALVALSQGWPVALLPPGRGEGQGTLTLSLDFVVGTIPERQGSPLEMPPPTSELTGAGAGFQPLAQAALGVLAWEQGAIALSPPESDLTQANLALVTALMGLASPWGRGVTWERLWPWLRWWVVQADPEILTWLAGVPGRWLVPGRPWVAGRLGLGVSLRFTPPETQWQVDVMAGTWQGEQGTGLSDGTRLQGIAWAEPDTIVTVAQVRSHLEARLRQGAPALEPLWTGMVVQWGLPQEPTTTLTGTLSLSLRLEALPA